MDWRWQAGEVVPGHQVASGCCGDPRFPEGTLRMQMPFFAERGLDLRGCRAATINLRLGRPWGLLQADHRFENLRWHPTEPAETFSFVRCRLRRGEVEHRGWIYHPHPETKPDHLQPEDVVELLMPPIEGLRYGDRLELGVEPSRVRFD